MKSTSVPFPRREFIGALAVAPFALPTLARAAESSASPVVDTHVHCFAGAGDARFPYHPRGPYKPPQATSPELLLKRMDEAGVDFAVIVHPEPYQDDHRYLEHCLAVGGRRLKGTSLFFADDRLAPEALRSLVKRNPGRIVTLRIHAYDPQRLPPFGKPELHALWRTAAELGLAIQLHFEPRHAAGFEPLIREFKETRVIIDHLGRPFQATVAEHALVVRWAQLPNTILKISSLPAPEEKTSRDLGIVVDELAQAFGVDRLIYGGGFDEKATGDSYRAARERVRVLLPRFSAAEHAKVLGRNASRIFGFSPA
jgi:predicted TIM-barrel fold metal-dependent hydrolase